MSTAAAGTAPAVKCSKCQKETDTSDDGGGNSDAAATAVALCRDCKDFMEATTTTTTATTTTTTTAAPAATVTVTATVTATQQQSKCEELITMEIDTDLTTTETLDDDLEEKDDTTKHEERNKRREEASQGARDLQEARPALPAETEPAATGPSDVKMAAELTTPTASPAPPQRTTPAAKVTRQNLNGARSPTVMKRLRKSTRSTRFKSKLTGRAAGAGGAAGGGATNNGAINGGHNGQGSVTGATPKAAGKAGGGAGGGAGGARNRRTLFKRPAQKTPRVQACTRFVKSLFYKGSYMQIGDIVSIVDSEQGVYYAQIRGLLVDAYCEKSAFLTWLIPTQDSPDPKEGFDPATYLIGKSARGAPSRILRGLQPATLET